MELLENERQMGACASLIVTNYRLLQEKKSWGSKMLKEIPLKKLDSIAYDYARSPTAVTLGILMSLIGFFLALEDDEFLLLMLIGFVVLIVGLLWKKELTEFRSSSMVIREEGRMIEEFVNIVRKQIYENMYSSEFSHNYRASLSREEGLPTPRIVSTHR